jgi:8-oxo-dGTP pyrophosphatase MutT (NUDIX family)
MHDDDLWQIYANNGTPIPGKGASPDIFDTDKSLNMGNAHIWFWKKAQGRSIEIMLQKRGPVKKRPGWFHISVGGHINVGETALQAAVREAKEEMGFNIDPNKLYFLLTTRVFGRAPHDIATVYLYKLTGNETFTHDDGEVAGFEWRTLDDFKEMTKDPESHMLVPMGDLYFGMLVAGLSTEQDY